MAIVWVSIFWLAGIFVGRQIPLETVHWLVLISIFALAVIVLRKHPAHRNLFILLIVFPTAGLRAQQSIKELDQGDLGFYNDLAAQARITGTLVADPDYRERHTVLRVRAERLIIPTLEIARPIKGDVLVHANPNEAWAYGDWVRVKGTLETPPQIDNFSYQQYLARKGVYSWVPQASVLKLGEGRGNPALRRIYTLRGSLHTTVGKLFPEPEASLVSGILLGIESDIPPRLYEDFNRTGTTHIIAISGFNITLIANLIIALSRRFFGARRGLWVAGLGIGLYTLLVGADAAVLRAAVMGGLALLARYWGRESHALASLGASSMMMTLITPTVLWDIGFQLSFAATLGLILYANPFHDWTVNGLSRWLSKQHAQQYGGLIAELFLYTFAAQITTWPLTMYYFRRFSLIAFAANPIILPLQPALMILSGAATILGSLWFPLGQAFALAAWPFPALTIRIVSFISSFATGGFGLSAISAKLLIGYYTALLSISIFSTRPQWLDRPIHILQSLGTGIRKRAVWGLGLAALSICFVWQSAAHSADGLLHMHILDVGMGDAILIQSPSGEHILINGGPSPSTLMNHLGRELPLIKRQLTAVILAGIRTNQSAGLVGLANHIQIATAFISPAHGSYSYRRVKEELTDGDLGVHEVQIGQRIEMGGGAQLEFLSCGPSGVTMLVTYGHARLLIPVGLSSEELDSLIFNQGVRDTAVLILSDGGHPSVNPRRWLEITNPQLVILSVSSTAGADRPSQEVLAYLANRVILRTDKHGSISLHTDGQKLWAETERLVTR